MIYPKLTINLAASHARASRSAEEDIQEEIRSSMEPTMLSMMTNTIKMQAAEPKSKLYETVEQEPPLISKPSSD